VEKHDHHESSKKGGTGDRGAKGSLCADKEGTGGDEKRQAQVGKGIQGEVFYVTQGKRVRRGMLRWQVGAAQQGISRQKCRFDGVVA